MATFTPITQQDAEAFLFPQGFAPVTLDGVSELVYGKRVDRDGLTLSLRVYTGINPNGESREKGTDAIRVTLFWRRPDGEIKMASGSKRVHRVEGWRKNLQARIDTIQPGRACTEVHVVDGKPVKCGAPMVERKSKRGKFLGCTNYPHCKGTAPVNGTDSKEATCS